MGKSKLLEYISSLDKLKSTGSVASTDIKSAEKELGVKFAGDYTEYVKEFGSIIADGIELTGICKAKSRHVVNATTSEWNLNNNIPHEMYVVEKLGTEGIVILQDTSGAIYEASPNKKPKRIYSNLLDYIKSNTENKKGKKNMKKVNESDFFGDNIFRSLIESEVEETEAAARESEDAFDSVFAMSGEEIDFDRVIKTIDLDLEDTIVNQMADPAEVKMVVKSDDVTGQNECYIAVEEFANFCKFSGLPVREAAIRLCEEAGEEDAEPENLNVMVTGTIEDSPSNEFVKHVIDNGINVCKCEDDSDELVQEGSWSDSMGPEQVEKWYNDLVKDAKNDKSTTKEEVKAKIAVLKACEKKMRKNIEAFDLRKGGHANPGTVKDYVEFTLKDLVPLKGLYNLLKYERAPFAQSVVRTLGDLIAIYNDGASLHSLKGLKPLEMLGRFVDNAFNHHIKVTMAKIGFSMTYYSRFLQNQVSAVCEAIDYLEDKLEKMDK